MAFKDRISEDVVNIFLDTDVFAETVTYYPAGNLGSGKSIKAIVDRGRPDPFLTDAGELVFDAELLISSDPTAGITTIEKDIDLADVILVEGGSPERVRVIEIVAQDEGSWTLRVAR